MGRRECRAMLFATGLVLSTGCVFDASGLGEPPASSDARVPGDRHQPLEDAGPVEGGLDADPGSCGNGTADGIEACDGSDLRGRACADVGYDTGVLGCTGGCAFDVSGCVTYPDWRCTLPVELDHTANGTNLTDFQVLVHLSYQARMRTDFSDLRFGDPGLTTNYPYWIEEKVDGAWAKVWVKVPVIAGSAVSIVYLHYANPAAGSQSDPTSVFAFYEDFESGSLGQWTAVAPVWSITTAGAHRGSRSVQANPVDEQDALLLAAGLALDDFAVDAWWWVDSQAMDIAQFVRATTTAPFYDYEANYVEWDCCWHVAKATVSTSWSSLASVIGSKPATGQWIKVTTEIVGQAMRVLIDDVQVVPASGWTAVGGELTSGSLGFRAWVVPDSHAWRVDDVRARKAANPAPTVALGTPTCYPP